MPPPSAERLITAADPLALAPILAQRLKGDELIVSESIPGRGVRAYTSGARGPREESRCSPAPLRSR